MKKNIKYFGFLFVITLLILSACSGNGDSGTEASSKDLSDEDRAALIDKYETTEELYEKAKKEGEVVIYSATSAGENVGLAFEEEYPGVKAVVTKVSDADILERIKREHESGVNNADVIFGKGTNGSWVNDLLADGILYDYKPEEITENMAAPYNDYEGLGLISEIITVIYNTDAYNEAPIDNWWDLTTPEWEGKVLMKDPLSAPDIQGLFMAMVKHADEMEAAYKDKFNEDIELDGTENAGYEFIKRLLENDAILMSSMGDSVDAVSESSQDKSPVAIASTVKLRDVVNDGAKIDMSPNLSPKVSVPGTSKVFLVNEVSNISAAKLFIRFMSGGEDGTGEGFDSFNYPGTFATRTDITQDNWLPSLSELNLWEEDEDYNYENADEMRDFLLKIK